MQLARDAADAEFRIRSCGPEGVRVNDELHAESLLLLPGRPVAPWPVAAGAELRPEDFAAFAAAAPELVLLGTGAALRFPGAAACAALLERGIGLEAMTTAAACRTYNLLAQDGRRVAAGLILPA